MELDFDTSVCSDEDVMTSTQAIGTVYERAHNQMRWVGWGWTNNKQLCILEDDYCSSKQDGSINDQRLSTQNNFFQNLKLEHFW